MQLTIPCRSTTRSTDVTHFMNISEFSRTSYRASGMSSAEALKDRLAQFKTKFTDFVSQTTGRRHTGYDELNQGLMAGQDDDDSRHTSSGTGGYSGPVPGYETHATGGFSGDRGGGQVPRAATFAQHVPSQVRDH